jgi:hypothetical protein
MRAGRIVTLVAGLLSGTAAARAHHSFAALFDPSRNIAIEGVVTEFQFIAPHAYIRVDVSNPDDTVVQWEIETTSPGQLIRAGLTPQTLAIGDRIAAVGNPTRDGRPLMRLLTITMPDGESKQIQ